ncbi:uncharacterized protein BDR25DRAFT_351722 [Lindgomyces ingoldianus]|uniref:Uncharacterized protein n=1 Tax=Lindgomyces ingoldianus TaxID=673940 RepID=A0ACB6R5X6_9PLEO|nr:uncharacterized protein BDR25DRAFT_351722 [Lindgomyces ingoldianus]KAF2474190.1 hypothetical protein BDR25DRAFT_351722 [Lindgomyces ingoldianus]
MADSKCWLPHPNLYEHNVITYTNAVISKPLASPKWLTSLPLLLEANSGTLERGIWQGANPAAHTTAHALSCVFWVVYPPLVNQSQIGVLANMWESDEQKYAVTSLVLSSVGGKVTLKLPWFFLVQLIEDRAIQLIHFFCMPEARVTILLDNAAQYRDALTFTFLQLFQSVYEQ